MLHTCELPVSTLLRKQKGNCWRQGAIVATLSCTPPSMSPHPGRHHCHNCASRGKPTMPRCCCQHPRHRRCRRRCHQRASEGRLMVSRRHYCYPLPCCAFHPLIILLPLVRCWRRLLIVKMAKTVWRKPWDVHAEGV